MLQNRASPLRENNSVLGLDVALLFTTFPRLFSPIVALNLRLCDDVDALGPAPAGGLIAVIWKSHLPARLRVPERMRARLTKTDLRTCYQEGAKAEQRKLWRACWRLILGAPGGAGGGPTSFPARTDTFLTPQVRKNVVLTSITYRNV